MTDSTDKFVKKYPKNLVVMQNKIQQCFKEMTLDEKRILIISSPKARMIDATESDAIEVTAEEFAYECGIKSKSAYKQLEIASQNLINRSFTYHNERGKKVVVTWVIRAIYEEGYISLNFPAEVLIMLQEFDKINTFTKYKKENVLKLKGEYSIDLYHLVKKHQGMKGFEMSLEDYKSELALPPSYDRINNLKARALHSPIEEINEKTDVTVSYKNITRGRKVTGFKFSVKAKPQPKIEISAENKTRDIPPLSNKQIDYFLKDFVNDPSISANAPIGMSMPEFQSHIRKKLSDSEYVQKHKEVLFRVGYKLR